MDTRKQFILSIAVICVVFFSAYNLVVDPNKDHNYMDDGLGEEIYRSKRDLQSPEKEMFMKTYGNKWNGVDDDVKKTLIQQKDEIDFLHQRLKYTNEMLHKNKMNDYEKNRCDNCEEMKKWKDGVKREILVMLEEVHRLRSIDERDQIRENSEKIAQLAQALQGNNEQKYVRKEVEPVQYAHIRGESDISPKENRILDDLNKKMANTLDEIKEITGNSSRICSDERYQVDIMKVQVAEKDFALFELNTKIAELRIQNETTHKERESYRKLSTLEKSRCDKLKTENEDILRDRIREIIRYENLTEILNREIDLLKTKLEQKPLLNKHDDLRTYWCGMYGCDVELLRDELVKFLQYQFPKNIINNATVIRSAIARTDDNSNDLFRYVVYLIAHGELFRTSVRIDSNGSLDYYVMMYGPDKLIDKFQFAFTLMHQTEFNRDLYIKKKVNAYDKLDEQRLGPNSVIPFIHNNTIMYKFNIIAV